MKGSPFSLTRYMALVKYVVVVFAISTSQVSAKPLMADLSAHAIAIDSQFTGTELLLFGSRNETGNVIVVVRGSPADFIVRKKERVAGIWMNTSSYTFKNMPQYYVMASTGEVANIDEGNLFEKLEIGLESLIDKAPPLGDEVEAAEYEAFRNALLRQRSTVNLYQNTVKDISFMGESLFKTVIPFPENIPRGRYTAETYLIYGGDVVGMQSTPVVVNKKGFDAFVFDLAHNHSLTYGILSVIMALIAGWVASVVFRSVK